MGRRATRRALPAVGLLACTALSLGWTTSRRSTCQTAPAFAVDDSVSRPPVPPAWSGASAMVVVAGHAVYMGRGDPGDEASWLLEPFQHGQLQTMIRHIRRGVELAAEDNASLLVFSGGETRATAGPRAEAASYWSVAEAYGWFGAPHVRERAILESHARDSFENLLFSVCRHAEASGRYPERITLVSFGFKRHRFVELHREAIRFPRDRFRFVGIDPPGVGVALLRNEMEHSVRPFQRDPYGCADVQLQSKRAARNPFRRHIGYDGTCPEMRELLRHCQVALYEGALPWRSS